MHNLSDITAVNYIENILQKYAQSNVFFSGRVKVNIIISEYMPSVIIIPQWREKWHHLVGSSKTWMQTHTWCQYINKGFICIASTKYVSLEFKGNLVKYQRKCMKYFQSISSPWEHKILHQNQDTMKNRVF